jgi:Fe-S cluster biogenesis protein NfuA
VTVALRDRVEAVLRRLRSQLVDDGGDITLESVSDDGVVKLCLKGGCSHCPMSKIALLLGLESTIKQQVPEVSKVEARTE